MYTNVNYNIIDKKFLPYFIFSYFYTDVNRWKFSFNMVNRIKKVIGLKNLSSSHFADQIGVQRATISHILSGRNKPSLEVIQKILDTFPDISSEWLVKGTGDINNSYPSLFENIESKDQHPLYSENERHEKTEQDSKLLENREEDAKNIEKEITPGDNKPDESDFPFKNTVDNIQGHTKKSIRVIIMYSDGTYTEHLPVTET